VLFTSASKGDNRTWPSGPPREILLDGTRLLWSPGDRLRLLSKLRILVEITEKNQLK